MKESAEKCAVLAPLQGGKGGHIKARVDLLVVDPSDP